MSPVDTNNTKPRYGGVNTMTNIPQTLKGFRDFLPEEKRRRDFVLGKIKEVFERFGFEPVETPTLEYANVIMGKYGAEADKLVYRFTDNGGREVALPYDQTVPTARLLIQYQNDLPKYFRRYAIRNVFRAEKPQKGRYREFTQCDIDIFGSTSPLADAEILACVYSAYQNIGFKTVKLAVNDRQTLFDTLKPYETNDVSVLSIIQSIDKLDKLPQEKVASELMSKGLTPESAQGALSAIQSANQSANLAAIINAATKLGIPAENLEFTPSLARGLDYYTGMIFEIKVAEYPSGSLGGGGRYDNLIKDLGGPNTPAVGMAFGFDRTVEAATELNLIPENQSGSQVLVTIFDESTQAISLELAAKLRAAEIRTEVFPSLDKIGKQFKLANQKNIPLVIIIGPDEAANKTVTIKDMRTGEQQTVPANQIVSAIHTPGV